MPWVLYILQQFDNFRARFNKSCGETFFVLFCRKISSGGEIKYVHVKLQNQESQVLYEH